MEGGDRSSDRSRNALPRLRPARVTLAPLIPVIALLAACGSPAPEATATRVPGPAVPSSRAASANVLSLALGTEPSPLLPGTRDASAARLVDLIYEGLYRLDERSAPVPGIAAALPAVSDGGRTLTVPLRPGVTFQDGSPVTPDDVVFTYQLALSPDCPFAALCAGVASEVKSVDAAGSTVRFRLREPAAPLIANALARLGIVPEHVLRAGLARFLKGATRVGAARARAEAGRVGEVTNRTECASSSPPADCSLAAHSAELGSLLDEAGVALPERRRFTPFAGSFDEEGYAGELLERVDLLAETLEASALDQLAAAFPLLDVAAHPVGAGPFALTDYLPGERVELTRDPGYYGGTAGPSAVRALILPDPAVAVAALRRGDVDWIPDLPVDQVAALTGQAGKNGQPPVRVAAHPGDSQRAIVFNVRPGRVYADVAARRAFALCLDIPDLVATATGERALAAASLVNAGSWAASEEGTGVGRDAARARATLDEAGWIPGADGIYARGGTRLSTALGVRPGRTDQRVFVERASESLRECGIELRVEDLDLAGDRVLQQLGYPNDFDTALVARDPGVDPDTALSAFEGRHITTAENPGDTNFGGWSSAETDALLLEGRSEYDLSARMQTYREVQRALRSSVPALPAWYEPVYAAVSDRVAAADGTPLDASRHRYDWAVEGWRLKNP